jgi:hypothetical protein
VTVPTPLPALTAVSGSVDGSNRAVTVRALLTVIVQEVGLPGTAVHPLQDLNTEPGDGAAESVTVL